MNRRPAHLPDSLETALASDTDHPHPEILDRPLLLTPEQAAELLGIRASWLKKKATARAIPCTFLGKHLRFSLRNLEEMIARSSRRPGQRGNR